MDILRGASSGTRLVLSRYPRRRRRWVLSASAEMLSLKCITQRFTSHYTYNAPKPSCKFLSYLVSASARERAAETREPPLESANPRAVAAQPQADGPRGASALMRGDPILSHHPTEPRAIVLSLTALSHAQMYCEAAICIRTSTRSQWLLRVPAWGPRPAPHPTRQHLGPCQRPCQWLPQGLLCSVGWRHNQFHFTTTPTSVQHSA